ncbi:type III polyketide synthase [Herbiconiux sp. A18JL235]|uniref:Type III polyketide synthase n=1 Tax=Herbiconiux sp. A18JL235 TaxID=3152363 RepID=A0AB39BMA5_9MICO
MAVYLRSIGTALPGAALPQGRARDLFAAQPGLSRLGRRLVTASFDASAIDTRYTVVDELTEGSAVPGSTDGPDVHEPVFVGADGVFLAPSTRIRNERYIERAPQLALDAAREALAGVPGVAAADVTHVVTVSCTGFFAPGPDYVLVRELGLRPTTQRLHVGFMGCYGVFPALRAAKAFCEADPDAVVLVVSVELCTLHMRSSNESDQIVASSVFGDGAAAAVVTSGDRGGDGGGLALRLDEFTTTLTPTGEEAMAWTIGDEGFEMVLSSYVPKIIDEHIEGALAPLLGAAGGTPRSMAGHWAVHPGGRSVLDRVQGALQLGEAEMDPSRQTLRTVGNLSSATVLFVLRRILESGSAAAGERVCAMAFGPGLTVEAGLFTIAGRSEEVR